MAARRAASQPLSSSRVPERKGAAGCTKVNPEWCVSTRQESEKGAVTVAGIVGTGMRHHPIGATGGHVTGDESSDSEGEHEGPQKLIRKVSTSGQIRSKVVVKTLMCEHLLGSLVSGMCKYTCCSCTKHNAEVVVKTLMCEHLLGSLVSGMCKYTCCSCTKHNAEVVVKTLMCEHLLGSLVSGMCKYTCCSCTKHNAEVVVKTLMCEHLLGSLVSGMCKYTCCSCTKHNA
ncbi:UNVERIFIED_CONTAM: hypothetical protein FKN15_047036 [Acipenser sinensis]